MVQLPHVLEQLGLVQPFITIVTVVTTEMEVAMLDVFHLATGLQKHQLARKVCTYGSFVLHYSLMTLCSIV